MIRLGVLGSTRGTHLNTLFNAIESAEMSASIKVVISNKEEALILKKAHDFNLPAVYINSKGKDRESFDKELSMILSQYKVDLLVLIGYMRILSSNFVNHWQNKIINIHPSLLPDYAGLMDLEVHQAVIDAKKLETGATVHYVTEKVDAGPIILQKKCPVFEADTAETLKARVQELEAKALIEAIIKIMT